MNNDEVIILSHYLRALMLKHLLSLNYTLGPPISDPNLQNFLFLENKKPLDSAYPISHNLGNMK